MALLEAGGDGVEDLGPGDPVSRRGGPENEQLEQGRHVLLISGSLTKKIGDQTFSTVVTAPQENLFKKSPKKKFRTKKSE